MKKILLTVACVTGLLASRAGADVVGADRLLGIIVPGTPARVENELQMVNGLLNGWTGQAGYNGGWAANVSMGDNPNDLKPEIYTLKYITGTVIPKPANDAMLPGYKTDTPDSPSAPYTLNLGDWEYDWLLAKWGQDSAIYYIKGLGPEITITLAGTGWEYQTGRGLSHYTLFNRGERDYHVPDGGTTVLLMGLGLMGLGALRRRFA